MTAHHIATRRLANQQLTATQFATPEAIATHLGALQGQDYAMVKWALGIRLPGWTEAAIEQAFDDGRLVRTHLLRPTWHVVAAADLRWMLKLTAPHLHPVLASYNRSVGLEPAMLSRSIDIIGRLLAGGRHLTREELMLEIGRTGIPTHEHRSAHLMFHAELEGLVCNGAMRGKQFTYALLEEKIAPGPAYTREEALGELAKRYFTSHGPATVADFSWWSGLNLTTARAALEAAQSVLDSEKSGAHTYWFPKTGSVASKTAPTVFFLPAFDEFMVSYKDRSAALDPAFARQSITGNGIFKPIVVVDGQVAGIWKRTVKKDTVLIETQFFTDAGRPAPDVLAAAAERFGAFLGLKTTIV